MELQDIDKRLQDFGSYLWAFKDQFPNKEKPYMIIPLNTFAGMINNGNVPENFRWISKFFFENLVYLKYNHLLISQKEESKQTEQIKTDA